MMPGLTMLGALLVGHALADYPLQGDFLARAKNRRAIVLGVPWWQALGAHALIHAGAVAAKASLEWRHARQQWLAAIKELRMSEEVVREMAGRLIALQGDRGAMQ